MDAGNGTIHRNPRNRKRSIIRNRPGPARPLSPRQGHWPWAHFAMKKTSYTKVFPHGTQGKNEYLSTGAMKTLKKVGREILFSLRPFFMFSPDASASGRRWNTASPWCQRYSRLAKCRFSLQLGYCVSQTTTENCLNNETSNIRHRVKGQCPLWGGGAKPPTFPPSASENCSKILTISFLYWLQVSQTIYIHFSPCEKCQKPL